MDQPIEEDLMEFLKLSPRFWRISYWEVSQVEAIAWQLMHTVYRFYFLIVQDLPVSEIMHWDVLGNCLIAQDLPVSESYIGIYWVFL